jgi:phosphoribosylglycinamide formyltransferase-1
MPSEDKKGIAIFASGGGSNADKICSYFTSHPSIQVKLIITNRSDAGVLRVADHHQIESVYISKKYWQHPEVILPVLESAGITHIILAGFLLLVPDWLTQAYSGRILNIHPALLPGFGGKGMYGHHVHEAVKASGVMVSGITIHEVNEHFDDGKIIFQHEVNLDETDSATDIARKVLIAEHQYYPPVIERWILG